jgi:hypothetical protein
MSEGERFFYCPRRSEAFRDQQIEGSPDVWRDDNTCSYCGSLNPALVLERIAAGSVTLEPTDKNYKVYVLADEGTAPFMRAYRNCPKNAKCTGPHDCDHWVTREQSHSKFYFMHFSEQQKHEFIALLNAKKMKFTYPGYFYRLPYFIGPAGK